MNLPIYVMTCLFIFTFCGYTIQTVTGFGAVIFALPLCMLFVNRLDVLPVFLMMSIYQSLSVAYKDKDFIDKIGFVKMFALAISGMIVGMMLGNIIPERQLNILLGIFIILNSLYSLYLLYSKKQNNKVLRPYHYTYTILSGMMQSAYGMGGPLISMYMDKVTSNKNTYRGMLSLYWGLLNPFIIIGYFIRGQITINHFYMFLLLFPAVLLGLFIGNKVLAKISIKRFQTFVYILLICIGITLFI